MGGGLAGTELATAVAAAGGLGTLGLAAPAVLRTAIHRMRDGADGRAVAVNLLMPFVRRSHVEECVDSRIDVAVMAFGIDAAVIRRLTDCGIFVFVMVGTERQAREAIACGADGLVAQGGDAGGHLSGESDAMTFLPHALRIAAGKPVLLAGGIANAGDTCAALAAGADGVVAGTRFLLTHESEGPSRIPTANPDRRQDVSHDPIRNELARSASRGGKRRDPTLVSRRRAGAAGTRMINAGSGLLARLPDRSAPSVVRLQTPAIPLFSPIAPTVDMPDSVVDRAALYAGQTVLRITSVISARQAVAELAPGGQ